MRSLTIATVLLCAGAARAEWEPPSSGEKVLLGVTLTAIAADCWTTADGLKRIPGARETNPLLGERPGNAKLFAWCGVGMAGTGALWYVLPSPWRGIATGAIGAVELGIVAGNLSMGARFRF